ERSRNIKINMRSFSFLLVGLLWVCPVSAAEDSDQSKKSTPKQNNTGPNPNGAVTRTPPPAGAGNRLIVQSGNPASSAEDASQVPPPAVSLPGADKKAGDEASGKNKRKDGNKDNPAQDKVPETVFKEMVITGETERDTHYTSPST